MSAPFSKVGPGVTDGTIVSTFAVAGEGVYVGIAGNDPDDVLNIAFDMADIKALFNAIYQVLPRVGGAR